MDPAHVHAKVRQYELFIENTLKRDLAASINAQEKVQQLHTDYSGLRQSLISLQSQHEAERAANGGAPVSRQQSMVNLGSEFYMQAVVPDPTRVCVDVGLGFHVELTLAEALAWIALKLPTLDTRLTHMKAHTGMVQSKIKVVYEGIAELLQLQQQQQKPKRQMF